MRLAFFLLCTAFAFAQQTQKVDFKTAQGNITINPIQRKVFGSVKYVLEVKQDIDTIAIDAQDMKFSSVEMDGKQAMYLNSKKQLKLYGNFKKGKYKLTFNYEANPKQTMYFNGDFTNPTISNQQVWTQGQGKYTSHWFPSFDDVNEKVVFNMNISFDKRFQVLSNGVLMHEYPDKGNIIWQYKMKKPMSSYLLAVAIGDYRHKVAASKSHIPIQMFVQPKDTAKFEPTYRHSKQIFDYLEKEIGFKYPWQIYKQVPVEDFLYAGMENTSCTIFAQDYVVDEIGFNDRNYINVNAHELAHQWFGDLITAKSGKHHWLQEGFATYYALLSEKEVFGDDYFYHRLYRNSLQLRNAAKKDSIPVMSEKASSLSFYEKGAWALHFMRESIGAESFRKAVKSYLKKYRFQNVDTDEFLAEVKKAAPTFDTDNFKKTWLEDYHFPTEIANDLLKKNKFMQLLFEVQQLRKKTLDENRARFTELLQSDVFYPVKTEIIYQLKDFDYADKKNLLQLAMQSKDFRVRQAVAEFMGKIPPDFKADYESLLDDNSYDTREIAFMNLWKNFPEDHNRYLAKIQNVVGGNDKSIRILFLTFSIENESSQSAQYYRELVDYTSLKYETSVRQNAIVSALTINPVDKTVLRNLINASTHYKWQFSKFAREKIRELLPQDGYRNIYENLLPVLTEPERVQLQKLLNEKP